HAFGKGDEIWVDIEIFDREHGASAPETRHYFIGDVQDSVFIAELANPRKITRWWHKDSVGAHDSLDDNGCNSVSVLYDDWIFQVLKSARRFLCWAFRPKW